MCPRSEDLGPWIDEAYADEYGKTADLLMLRGDGELGAHSAARASQLETLALLATLLPLTPTTSSYAPAAAERFKAMRAA